MEEYTHFLVHHGVKGQRWGVRRYQNPDGSLTEAGRNKLGKYKQKELSKLNKRYDKSIASSKKQVSKFKKKLKDNPDKKRYKNLINSFQGSITIEKAMKFMEQKAVNKMAYADMKKEKKEVGKAYVKTIAASTLGMIPLAFAEYAGLPVGVGVISTWSPTAVKYNLRAERTRKDAKNK